MDKIDDRAHSELIALYQMIPRTRIQIDPKGAA